MQRQVLSTNAAILIGCVIVGIITVEVFALSRGINGFGLSAAVGALCTIGGYLLRAVVTLDRNRKKIP